MAGKMILGFAAGCLMVLTAGCTEPVPLEAPLQATPPLAASFNSDETQCRAEAGRVGEGHVGKTAAVGGVIGAAGGAIEGSDDALIGALLGAAVGAAAGDFDVKQARRNYLVRCMQQRGHAVTG
ncbi:hypothetical protein [Pseudophaeobacter sp.]|uniref:hypothetical protein n=1 Tax=Pseudophaeobacter sp. TaxID=1971739 RepID=UPI00405A0081